MKVSTKYWKWTPNNIYFIRFEFFYEQLVVVVEVDLRNLKMKDEIKNIVGILVVRGFWPIILYYYIFQQKNCLHILNFGQIEGSNFLNLVHFWIR